MSVFHTIVRGVCGLSDNKGNCSIICESCRTISEAAVDTLAGTPPDDLDILRMAKAMAEDSGYTWDRCDHCPRDADCGCEDSIDHAWNENFGYGEGQREALMGQARAAYAALFKRAKP